MQLDARSCQSWLVLKIARGLSIRGLDNSRSSHFAETFGVNLTELTDGELQGLLVHVRITIVQGGPKS